MVLTHGLLSRLNYSSVELLTSKYILLAITTSTYFHLHLTGYNYI